MVSTNVVFNERTEKPAGLHFKALQQELIPFGPEERSEAEFKWLEGTFHRDDDNQLLYRTTRVGTWRNPVTQDRVIVAWRSCVMPTGEIEERTPVHIADVERMKMETPGQQDEAFPEPGKASGIGAVC